MTPKFKIGQEVYTGVISEIIHSRVLQKVEILEVIIQPKNIIYKINYIGAIIENVCEGLLFTDKSEVIYKIDKYILDLKSKIGGME